MSLSGKVAVVTGGGRGIGRAIALRLAREGLRVIAAGRTRAEIDAVAAETNGLAWAVDLGDFAALPAALDALAALAPRVDVLINNAGVAESALVHRTTDEQWDRLMTVNAKAPFALTRAMVPGMLAAKWGRIVNVASVVALHGEPYTAAYAASKHALLGLTRSVAIEVAPHGVTVNAVCPGWVETDIVRTATARIAEKTKRSVEDATSALAAMSPQRRIFTSDEVAHAVWSFVPDEARGLNGTTITIDGGLGLH